MQTRGWPVILVHTRGVTSPERKNFPVRLERETIRRLLEIEPWEPEVVYLDWHGDGIKFDHPRFRKATHYTPELLLGMIHRANVLLGIDSGPYHLARLTKTPRVGVWWGIPPWHAAIPRASDLNLYRAADPITPHRGAWNIREGKITAEAIVTAVEEKLWSKSQLQDTPSPSLAVATS